jgi:hypothetical protein
MATVDAVLPVTAKDVLRARILLLSLDRFFQGLDTCWVIPPDRDLETVRKELSSIGLHLRFLPESEIVPEALSREFRSQPTPGHPGLTGVMVAQLAKIGIGELVAGDFYLTLAAGTVCTRPTQLSDLIVSGRALATVIASDADKAAASVRTRYQEAADVLALPLPARFHGECPALLSREVSVRLREHLVRLSGGPGRQPGEGEWRRYLIQHQPWTEHALYGTYLDAMGLFDRFHFNGGPSAFYGNSVCSAADFATWDPASSFAADAPWHFSRVQTSAGVSGDELWRLVGRFLSLSPS